MYAHFHKISQIQARLERRISNQEKAEVRIRDIIAYQVSTKPITHLDLSSTIKEIETKKRQIPKGEFYAESLDEKYDAKAAESESDASVIKRIFEYIDSIAYHAAQLHLETNFSSSANILKFTAFSKKRIKLKPHYKMKSENVNRITRVLLNEFALYINKIRGPISDESYKNLIAMLKEMAQYYPENLQLVLASIPIKFTMRSAKKINTVFQNITIIINCGPIPIIKSFAKSFIASDDPQYPDISMHTAVNVNALETEYSEMTKKLVFKLQTNSQTVEAKDIAELMDHTNLTFRKKTEEVIEFLNHLKMILSNVRTKKYDEKAGQTQAIDDSNQLTQKRYKILRKERAIEDYPIAQLQLKENKDLGTNLEYGGIFVFTTAGGVKYFFFCDMCVDHGLAVAKQTASNKVHYARLTSQGFLPIFGSHVLLSNSFSIEKDSLVSATVSRSDPIHSSRNYSVVTVSETAETYYKPLKKITLFSGFGAETVMEAFAERSLTHLLNGLDLKVLRNNKFIAKLDAMKIYRGQLISLEDIEIINKMINQFILFDIAQATHQFILTKIEYVHDKNQLVTLEKILLNALHQNNLDFQIEILTQISQINPKDVNAKDWLDYVNDVTLAIELLKNENENSNTIRLKNGFPQPVDSSYKMESKGNMASYWLHYSDDRSHVDFIKSLINSGAYEEKGNKPIHIAAGIKQIKVLDDLLEQKRIDIDHINGYGKTALHIAAKQGRLGNIILLLEKNANPFIEDYEGKTFFEIYAVDHFDVSLLVQIRPDLFFMEASSQIKIADTSPSLINHLFKRYEFASELERQLLEPTIMFFINHSPFGITTNGKTIFHLATESRFPHLLSAILERKGTFDVDSIKIKNKTAFHLAAEKGNIQNIEILLEKGAKLDRITSQSENALHLAAKHGHIEAIIYLIKKGIDCFLIDDNGKTFLQVLIENHPDIDMSKLIEKTIDKINYFSPSGFSDHCYKSYTERMLELATRIKENKSLLSFIWIISNLKPLHVYKLFKKIETQLSMQARSASSIDHLKFLKNQKTLCETMLNSQSDAIKLSVKFHFWTKNTLSNHLKQYIREISINIENTEKKLLRKQQICTPRF